ncbi:MAG: STAS domain-containing protein [Planctomycetota bacterium]|jgi:anti-anti-sigma factor
MSGFSITEATHVVDRPSGPVNVHVLSLVGEVDAYTFPALQARLEALHEHGSRAIVLDSTELAYMSSAGLGVLKLITNRLREGGGDLRLAALSPKLRKIFDMLGFSRIIRCFDDTEAAIASFAKVDEEE